MKKELWRPTLSNYLHLDTAFSNLKNDLPAEFFENPLSLPVSDKITGAFFIACGLGIAYIFELERQGVKIISLDEINNFLGTIAFDPFAGLK